MKRELTLLAVLPLAAVALAACGSGDSIEVDGAWARTSPMATDRGAVYFEITADEADTLVSVSVDGSVAGAAGIHEMVMADMGESMDDDMDDDMDDEMSDDMAETPMMMQEMSTGLPLPAGETVVLEPGSYHVMLLDLVDPLETGEEFELTLGFADGDDLTIEVPVRESAP